MLALVAYLIAASLWLTMGGAPIISLADRDSGLYIGGGVGQSSVDSNLEGVSSNLDDGDSGYKISLGYNFRLLPF